MHVTETGTGSTHFTSLKALMALVKDKRL